MIKARSNKHLTILGFLTLFLFLHFSSSHPTNSTGGYTAAPGDSTCLQCHNQSSAIQGNIEVTDVPASPIPGETYPMTVVINNTMGSASRAGFQMVALRTSTNTNTGSFSVPTSESKAQVKTVNGKQYIGHANSARTFSNNVVEYEVEWTAPTNQDGEEIRFYAAALIGNGSGTSGDRYVVTNTTSTIQSSGTDPLEVTFQNVQAVLCTGEANGSATAVASGGAPDYQYAWSSGESTATATALVAGTNSVTVTDADGISTVGDVSIGDAPAITIATTFTSNVTCAGDNDGEIVVGVAGGTGTITLTWNTGAQGNSITNLAAGTYTVTATDANGCTEETSVAITEPAPIILTQDIQQQPACAGGSDGVVSVQVTGGSSPYTYEWSSALGFADDGVLEGVPAGDYEVTVTDGNGCTATTTATLGEPSEVVLTIDNIIDELCPDSATGAATAVATGGTGAISYIWSNGDTDATTTGLAAGLYTVTATDSNGCSTSQTVEIASGIGISVSLTVLTSPTCGIANGSILATPVGATEPIVYLWNTNATTDQIDNLLSGSYTVTVTDGSGCTAESTVMLNDEDGVLLTIAATQDITCSGESDGTITTSAVGGTAPLSYTWSDGSTDAQRTGLPAGTYTVSVTDANGCQSIADAELTEPPVLLVTTSSTNVSTTGGNDGTATATATGGSPDYTYLWSNGATTPMIGELAEGTYGVTVTDSNGCTATSSTSIQDIDCSLVAMIEAADLLCAGDSNGSAQVIIANGVEPYSIVWSTGALTSNISDLTAGTYSVTVTDAEGCISADDVLIDQPEPIVLTLSAGSELPAVINVTVGGGVSPYTFLWSTSDTEASISVGESGTYQVTVTDSNSCTAVGEVTIEDVPCTDSLLVTTVGSPVCFGDSTASITAILLSGSVDVAYSWSTGNAGNSLENLAQGTYSVTATAADGCVYTLEGIAVTENPQLTIALDEILPATGSASSDGSILVTADGGTGPYTFQWFDETDTVISTDQDLTNARGGFYYLCVTDAAGCSILSEAYEITISTSTADLADIAVSIYPNPTVDVVQVDASSEIVKVQLFTSNGQLVRLASGYGNRTVHLETATLPAGTYTLSVHTALGTLSEQLTVVK